MVRELILTGVVLALAQPVFAQSRPPTATDASVLLAPPTVPPPNPIDPRKPAVLSFETNLRQAVELAGQRMTEHALRIAPVQIVQTRAAIVRGVPLEGFGYHFDVQIPLISGSGVMMLEMAQRNQQQPIWAPNRNVSQTQEARTSATAVVTPDPVGRPPVTPVTEASLNSMYTNFVKDALIDAIVDTAGVLVLTDSDRLLVSAGPDDVLTSQLQRVNTRQLLLTIKGADLNALRSGGITRDQVRDRIEVKAF